MTSDCDLLRFLDTHYRLGSRASLRWRECLSEERVGFCETSRGRYVVRLYAGTDSPKARFLGQFLPFLQAHGVEAERIVRSQSGQPVSRLPSGESLIVYQFHPGSQLSTECQSDYQTWGRYVGRLHRVGQTFGATEEWPAPLTSLPAERWLADALAGFRSVTAEAQILLDCRPHILQVYSDPDACCVAVHGDLWPGNLLVGRDGPRAIDFADTGIAPLAVDLATAFRWLPWDRPELARQQWGWWLRAYEEEWRGPLPAQPTVAAWAMLQQVRYLVEEVESCLDGRDGPGVRPVDYVTDHAAKLRQLLSVAAA